MNEDEALEEWRMAVSRQLADPRSAPFVAAVGDLLVLGGQHFGDFDYCWCQETMRMHGCGHPHGEHRRTMD